MKVDIRGDGDGLNVFELLIPGALNPGQKLLDCPVVGGSRISVADRDRKKLEEFFAGSWASAGDECGGCERI